MRPGHEPAVVRRRSGGGPAVLRRPVKHRAGQMRQSDVGHGLRPIAGATMRILANLLLALLLILVLLPAVVAAQAGTAT